MPLKNIAILHYSCPPIVGGVEEIVRQQASLFSRNFHPVKILAGMGKRFTDEFEIEINPLLSSRHSEILNLQRDATTNQDELKHISWKILDYLSCTLQSFDVVIAHNVLSMRYNLPLTMALHALADSGKKKVIGWNHDSPYFYRPVQKELKKGVWQLLSNYNPNISYVTISESRKQEFEKLYNKKGAIKVINNGIDPIWFLRLDRTSVNLIREENLFNCQLIMVQPSRLHPRKNIELSISVLHALHESDVKAKLLLTGAYDPHEKKTLQYYHKLRNLARELKVDNHLIIVSEYEFKSGEKLVADRVMMRDLYLISDLLFFPSKQEGFGIPLLEAGMIRLPIACADIAPFRNIAGQNVLYFSLKESPGTIARRIMEFMNGLETQRMYKNVIRDYVWDNIYVRKLLPFLESL